MAGFKRRAFPVCHSWVDWRACVRASERASESNFCRAIIRIIRESLPWIVIPAKFADSFDERPGDVLSSYGRPAGSSARHVRNDESDRTAPRRAVPSS